MNLDIKDQFYSLKKVHNIRPTYYIDFEYNTYTATVIYCDVLLESKLLPCEIRHIDKDYLYYDVALLLTKKLNEKIEKLNALNTP
jgi:hypothetical protein